MRIQLQKFLTKTPLSIAFLATILLFSFITGSYHQAIDPNIEKTFGLSLDNIRHGKLYVLITYIPLTRSPIMLLGVVLASTALFIYEYLVGTRKAAKIYLITNYFGVLTTLALALLGFAYAQKVDVGASIGFWGALGAAIPNLPYKKITLTLSIGYLILSFFTRVGDVANIEHPSSFILGLVIAYLINRHKNHAQQTQK